MMKHTTHRIVALLMFLCALAFIARDARAQADFSGTYKGEYELGEAAANVELTATLTPRGGRTVRVRWREQTEFEGEGRPEPPTVSVVTGTIRRGRLQFFVPTKFNRRRGTTYTATMRGDSLVVRFSLYYDPQGAYSVSPCRGCIKADREVVMTRQ